MGCELRCDARFPIPLRPSAGVLVFDAVPGGFCPGSSAAIPTRVVGEAGVPKRGAIRRGSGVLPGSGGRGVVAVSRVGESWKPILELARVREFREIGMAGFVQPLY